MSTRRRFITLVPLLSAAAFGARAAAPEVVDEKDPTAASLGYVADAKRADKTRFKQYAAGQTCGNCQLYQGAAGGTNGPCPIYGGKTVTANGWCSAYVRKA